MIIGSLSVLILYVITLIFVLFAFAGGAAHADVLDHHHSLAAQLAHQILGAHHIPLTLLLIVVGVISIWGWRAARKKA